MHAQGQLQKCKAEYEERLAALKEEAEGLQGQVRPRIALFFGGLCHLEKASVVLPGLLQQSIAGFQGRCSTTFSCSSVTVCDHAPLRACLGSSCALMRTGHGGGEGAGGGGARAAGGREGGRGQPAAGDGEHRAHAGFFISHSS